MLIRYLFERNLCTIYVIYVLFMYYLPSFYSVFSIILFHFWLKYSAPSSASLLDIKYIKAKINATAYKYFLILCICKRREKSQRIFKASQVFSWHGVLSC